MLSKEGKFTLAVLLLIVSLGAFYIWRLKVEEKQVEQQSRPAYRALLPSSENGKKITFTDINGHEVSLDKYLGKVLVVNSWASWSPDSAKELPMLSEVARDYDPKGVKVLAINRAETAATAKRFMRHVNAIDKVELLLDPSDHYYSTIGGYAMPETVIYDEKGDIIVHHRGLLTKDKLIEYLNGYLSKETKPTKTD